jgi:hypothetical protein
MTYHTNIKVKIRPIWFDRLPTISIGINGQRETIKLSKERWFAYDYTNISSTGYLEVELIGKTNKDTDVAGNRDTAVVIEEILLNDLSSPKFAWAGVYTPNYPPHVQGEEKLSPHTYLGWNGVWRLDYTLPIYTWIHQIENLGWIYD